MKSPSPSSRSEHDLGEQIHGQICKIYKAKTVNEIAGELNSLGIEVSNCCLEPLFDDAARVVTTYVVLGERPEKMSAMLKQVIYSSLNDIIAGRLFVHARAVTARTARYLGGKTEDIESSVGEAVIVAARQISAGYKATHILPLLTKIAIRIEQRRQKAEQRLMPISLDEYPLEDPDTKADPFEQTCKNVLIRQILGLAGLAPGERTGSECILTPAERDAIRRFISVDADSERNVPGRSRGSDAVNRFRAIKKLRAHAAVAGWRP